MKDSILSESNNPFPMTEGDLRRLGMDEIGYIKQYRVNGKAAWVLHAADGTALAVQNNLEQAQISALHKELDVATLH